MENMMRKYRNILLDSGCQQNRQEATAPPERGAGLKGLRGLASTGAYTKSMFCGRETPPSLRDTSPFRRRSLSFRHPILRSGAFTAITICLLAASCTTDDTMHFHYDGKDGQRGEIRLERVNDSLCVLHHSIGGKAVSEWELPYPVYRMECGDLTGDGVPEIAVGVIKPTRYFPRPERRIFLFKLYKGRLIRPLWLGSRVARPLVDFHLVRDSVPARILTTERHSDGTLVQALYRQQGFGLVFERDIPQ